MLHYAKIPPAGGIFICKGKMMLEQIKKINNLEDLQKLYSALSSFVDCKLALSDQPK